MSDILSKLLEPLIDPILKWIRSLSLKLRLALLLVIALPAAVGWDLQRTHSILLQGKWIAYAAARPLKPVPLSKDARVTLAVAIENLKETLRSDFEKRGQPGFEAWPIAQATVATHDVLDGLDWRPVAAFFHGSVLPGCGCWTEINSAGYPRNIVISGWVLSALAELREQASPAEIEFLLRHQSPDGWWSVFPVPGERREYASTYATAWALIGLQRQLAADLVVGSYVGEVKRAIRTGGSWLLAHREGGARARWRYYPLEPESTVSRSLSGLAVHALHLTRPGSSATANLAREWLDSLPEHAPSLQDSEPLLHWINGEDGRHADHFTHVVLPWMMVATIDSYSSGSITQRAAALAWLERVLGANTRDADTQGTNWWRAELLLAARHALEASTD